MQKAIIAALVCLSLAPAWGQGVSQVTVGSTAISGGVNNNCLSISSGLLASSACSANIAVGTTLVSGGASGRILYDNAGVVGEYTSAAAKSFLSITSSDVSGLGTAATQNTGTSGATLPFLNGSNTWSAPQTFGSNALVLNGSSLIGEASNVVAQRDGTTPQAFYLYNSYSDALNYERAELVWSSTYFKIRTTNAGTGSARDIWLYSAQNVYFSGGNAPSAQWRIDATSGAFLSQTDSAVDIGASGTNRPGNGYFGKVVYAASFRATTVYSAAGTALPTCNIGAEGSWAAVSDATAPSYNAAYTSGGTVHVPVYCDGSGWKTH